MDDFTMRYQKLWTQVRSELKNIYEEDTFNENFGSLTNINRFVDGYIYVIVEEEFSKNKINKFYINRINELVKRYVDSSETIKFKFITKDDLIEEVTPVTADTDLNDKYRPGNLDATYTFQNFVVGKSNHFACTMSLKIADQPGKIANPLYIFGDVGLGKTHLMQSIGNFILDKDITQKVLYVEASSFSEEYIKCSSSTNNQNKFNEFHKKYRDLDVLLVDDIQILSDRTKTQEEFFNLFNILYMANKQIVITSDRPANALKGMMDRLTSRFASGLTIDIGVPDLDLRVDILKKKLQTVTDKKDMLSDEILNYIASYFTTNIRELEGALKRVIYYCVLTDAPITLELAQEALEPLIRTKKISNKLNENNYDKIQSIVCDYYGITINELIGSKRSLKYIVPRHIAMYLIKKKYDLPYKTIGALFNNRDHSTVLSACEKIENEIKIDSALKMAVDNILKKIDK